MFYASLALLTGLLLVGAAIDISCRRLPNWLTSAVAALYGIHVIVSPAPVDWMGAFMVAGIMLAAGFGLFTFNLMGGGDVKLIAALALWAGVDHIALFLLVTSLVGGLLSISTLLLHRLFRSPLAMAFWPAYETVAGRCTTNPDVLENPPAEATENHADPAMGSLPYGVAIAAGGLAVIYALLQL